MADGNSETQVVMTNSTGVSCNHPMPRQAIVDAPKIKITE